MHVLTLSICPSSGYWSRMALSCRINDGRMRPKSSSCSDPGREKTHVSLAQLVFSAKRGIFTFQDDSSLQLTDHSYHRKNWNYIPFMWMYLLVNRT